MAPPVLTVNGDVINLNYNEAAPRLLVFAAHHIVGHLTMVNAIQLTGKERVIDSGNGISITGKLISENLNTGMQQANTSLATLE